MTKKTAAKTPTKALLTASFIMSACLPNVGLAENTLSSLDTPPVRPYPYKVLGLQPGDSVDEVMELFASRSEAEPTGESDIIRVDAPDGRSFEFTYERSRRIGDIGVHGRLAKGEQDQVTAYMASDVLHQRPLEISRIMRKASDELPEALALRAQIEETYGPPSQVTHRTGNMTLLYAWGEDGFIPSLEEQEEQEFTLANGRVETYQPCLPSSGGGFQSKVDWKFQHPRKKEIMPGCVATFRVSYNSKPGKAGVSFTLQDFELARQHTKELDRQIIEELTGEVTDVEASDIDL